MVSVKIKFIKIQFVGTFKQIYKYFLNINQLRGITKYKIADHKQE